MVFFRPRVQLLFQYVANFSFQYYVRDGLMFYFSYYLRLLFWTAKHSYLSYRHPYHLVDVSPWPFFISLFLLNIMFGTVLYLHEFVGSGLLTAVGFSGLLLIFFVWFRDIIYEGTLEGHHTAAVQRGLKIGMVLFILSEVMFFFSFFWAFFHSSLVPAIEIGSVWPPLGITVFDPWDVPLLNTLILLSSGISVTWAHYAIRFSSVYWPHSSMNAVGRISFFYHGLLNNLVFPFFRMLAIYLLAVGTKRSVSLFRLWLYSSKVLFFFPNFSLLSFFRVLNVSVYNSLKFWFSSFFRWCSFFSTSRVEVLVALFVTVLLGVLFTLVQGYEYWFAPFTISDGIYGSVFFLTTGFHGLHVIIGTVFLLVCFFRTYFYHFSTQHHVGLEAAIWYWHFVDVVWLYLYMSVYLWGGVWFLEFLAKFAS